MEYTKEQLVHLVNFYTVKIAKIDHEKRQRDKLFTSDPRCLNWTKIEDPGMLDFNPEKVKKKSYEKATLANMRNTLSQKRKKLRDLKLIILKQKTVCQFLYKDDQSMVNEIFKCKTEEEIYEKIELFYKFTKK